MIDGLRLSVVAPPQSRSTGDPEWIREFAYALERLGFDELSLVEHPVVVKDTSSVYPYAPSGRSPLDDDCPLPDPLVVLAYVAAGTRTLGLATSVLVLPAHHPVPLAKTLATVDRLSAGRLRVVVGLGWMREEIQACGGSFDVRGRVAEEAIAVMRSLWQQPDGADFVGTFFVVRGAVSRPGPVRGSGVPIMVGGHSPAAARRAGRIGDGFQPLGLAGPQLDAALEVMWAARAGSERADLPFELVLGGSLQRADLAMVERARARGASRLVLSLSDPLDTLVECQDQLARAAARLGLA